MPQFLSKPESRSVEHLHPHGLSPEKFRGITSRVCDSCLAIGVTRFEVSYSFCIAITLQVAIGIGILCSCSRLPSRTGVESESLLAEASKDIHTGDLGLVSQPIRSEPLARVGLEDWIDRVARPPRRTSLQSHRLAAEVSA